MEPKKQTAENETLSPYDKQKRIKRRRQKMKNIALPNPVFPKEKKQLQQNENADLQYIHKAVNNSKTNTIVASPSMSFYPNVYRLGSKLTREPGRDSPQIRWTQAKQTYHGLCVITPRNPLLLAYFMSERSNGKGFCVQTLNPGVLFTCLVESMRRPGMWINKPGRHQDIG